GSYFSLARANCWTQPATSTSVRTRTVNAGSKPKRAVQRFLADRRNVSPQTLESQRAQFKVILGEEEVRCCGERATGSDKGQQPEQITRLALDGGGPSPVAPAECGQCSIRVPAQVGAA